jgi:lysophospholipase L1-like esterase
MRRRKIDFALALSGLLISLVVIEVGLRVYLASRLGPGILWYGTRYNTRQIKGMYERERWAAADDPRALRGDADERHTVRRHTNEEAGYSKFFPGELKYTYDVDTGETIPVRINNQGFRGPDYEIAKPLGTMRIVTLGASSTFGYHDRDGETYPHYLQEILAETCGRQGPIEVINLGVPHLRSDEILRLFRAEALPLRPEIVTFYEGINDSAFDKPKKAKPPWRRRLASAFRMVREHFVVAAFVQEYLRSEVRRFSAAAVERHRQGRSEAFLGNLAALHDECRAHGITLIVANQQGTSLLVPRKELRGVTYAEEQQLVERKLALQGHVDTKELNFLTHRILMHDLAAWAAANGVPFVDIITALDRRRDVLVSWVHLTAEGNRLIAHELAEAIRPLLCPATTRQH